MRAVEGFGARVGVQDDLLVASRELNEFLDDCGPEPLALVLRVNRDVGDVGTVEAVSQGATHPDKFTVGVDKAFEPAVRKHRRQILGRLLPKRSYPIQPRQLLPIH